MTTTVAARRVAPSRTNPDAPMTHRQILESMTGLLAALFTAMLSSTIVSVALPTIIGDLHGTQRQYTWVITAALLATTVSTPIWGKLADLFSKKLLVQISIGIFVAGSVAAGFAHTVPFLLSMRVVQGLGMGGLTALVQAIMGSIIAPRERGRYAGYMGAVMAVSTVSGPLLGGLIVDTALGWRWTFFVCVPLALISLFVIQATLHVSSGIRRPKIDYLGAVLLAATASLPMIWVTFAGNDFGWLSWQTAVFLGATALLLVVTVVWELRVPEPLVPLRLLANRTAILVIIASVAVGIGMFGGTTFLGQYFQLARGYSPTHAGLLTIPLMVAMLISSTVTGQIVSRTGRWKRFLVGGAVLLTAGLGLLGTIDHATPNWQLGVYMALMGLGMGAMMQNLVLAVQNTVDVRDIGATSASVAFFRSLGGAIGVSVLGAVLADQVQNKIIAGVQALGAAASGAAIPSDLDLTALPAPILAIVRSAYGDATGMLFGIGACFAAVSLISVILVKEVPLRKTVQLEPAATPAPQSISTSGSSATAKAHTGTPRRALEEELQPVGA
jgi:EmrB/QacA subfamily drug resistance transporter